jgi:hypothetical protein
VAIGLAVIGFATAGFAAAGFATGIGRGGALATFAAAAGVARRCAARAGFDPPLERAADGLRAGLAAERRPLGLRDVAMVDSSS